MSRILIVCGGSGVDLLGQRERLRFDAELQVDVSNEIVITQQTNFSRSVALDSRAATTNDLLSDMQNYYTQDPARRHMTFLARNWLNNQPLMDGLSRSPALGGLAVRQPQIQATLENQLRVLLSNIQPQLSQANPLHAWIVSSTAGGTGEGTHRFVGESLVKILRQSFMQVPVKLHFIRIGPGTYQLIDQTRTSVNTFFGIAADAAFSLRLQKVFRDTSVVWYYLDLPPVGSGSTAKPIRARLIEMAAKALLLDELSGDLAALIVNDSMLLFRAGFWTRDFNKNEIYVETLKGLRDRLNELIKPNTSRYAEGASGAQIRYDVPGLHQGSGSDGTSLDPRSLLENPDRLLQAMNQGWTFPRYTIAAEISQDRDESGDQARIAWDAQLRSWRGAVSNLLPKIGSRVDILDRIRTRYLGAKVPLTEEGAPPQPTELIVNNVPHGSNYNIDWFERIDEIQYVKATCQHLLDGPDGLRVRLLELARQCSDAQYRGNRKVQAEALSRYLGEFCLVLEQVNFLRKQRQRAKDELNAVGALVGPRRLLGLVDEAIRVADVWGANEQDVAVEAANLWDPLGQQDGNPISWLAMLLANDTLDYTDNEFRPKVLRGATGLTHTGLVKLLNLHQDAQHEQIKKHLATSWGQIPDLYGRSLTSHWWQNREPQAYSLKYRYQIFPKLERDLKARLGTQNGDISYKFTELGAIGLSVLALDAVAIAQFNDGLTSPAFLAEPFVHAVRTQLNDWVVPQPQRPSGKLMVAAAAAPGTPLHAGVLAQLHESILPGDGLTDEEMHRIEEFYELYSPPVASGNGSGTTSMGMPSVVLAPGVPST